MSGDTVLRWYGPGHWQHRIRVKQVPGSAHWHIMKDSRNPSKDWERDWGQEARTKPDFEALSEGES